MMTKEEIQKKNQEFGRTFVKPFLIITFGALIVLVILMGVLSCSESTSPSDESSVERQFPDVVFKGKRNMTDNYNYGFGYIRTHKDGSKYMIVLGCDGGITIIEDVE